MGEKIKHLRILSQMTQDEVAEKLDCDREKVSRYENDKIKPELFMINHSIVAKTA